jgi:serine protease Do
MEHVVKSLVKIVSPSVVSVEVGSGSGSGVIVSPEGLVLTAGHVCGRPNREVRFTFPDGKTAQGKTLGLDRDSDTGLMRITDPGPWPYSKIGNLDQTELGDWVLALGHPGGFDPKRSLVVRLGRIIRLAQDALQTDCTIAPGDSGGPLFDMHGRVIGIHSAISSSVAENFHVSITEFIDNWELLASGSKARTLTVAEKPKSYVGVAVIDDAAGCRLNSVDAKSPAAKAGLRSGDLILRVNQREIKAAAAFRRWVAEAEPGEVLTLEIKRGGKLLSLKLNVRPPPPGGQ